MVLPSLQHTGCCRRSEQPPDTWQLVVKAATGSVVAVTHNQKGLKGLIAFITQGMGVVLVAVDCALAASFNSFITVTISLNLLQVTKRIQCVYLCRGHQGVAVAMYLEGSACCSGVASASPLVYSCISVVEF